MASATLEKTIDKILGQTENNVLSSIESALTESQQKLDDAIPKLEQEYNKIISDGKKEAEKDFSNLPLHCFNKNYLSFSASGQEEQ